MSRTKRKNLLSTERQNRMNLNSRHRPSNAVGALFLEAVARQKAKSEAEAAEVIDKVKAQVEALAKVFEPETEERTRAYTDTITKVKAETEEKTRTYNHTITQVKPSTRVGALFLEAIAKQKTKSESEAAEAIAKVRAEAEEKARTYTEMINRVKSEAVEVIAKVKAEAIERIAEQKAKSEAEAAEAIAKVKAEALERVAEQKAKSEAESAEAIAKVRAEAEEKARTYTDTITRVKAEATEVIAKVKTGPRIEQTVYPKRLRPWGWLLKGLRQDDAAAVIVFCLLLCSVLSIFGISGYFVYTILRAFL